MSGTFRQVHRSVMLLVCEPEWAQIMLTWWEEHGAGRDVLTAAIELLVHVLHSHSSCDSTGLCTSSFWLLVLVNYTICFSCHSRHQLAPLSRLCIWTASHVVRAARNMSCVCHDSTERRKRSVWGSLIIAHPGLLHQAWISDTVLHEMLFISCAGLSVKTILHHRKGIKNVLYRMHLDSFTKTTHE